MQRTALGRGEQANCLVAVSVKQSDTYTQHVDFSYQSTGSGGVAHASLPGGAGETVAAVDASRSDGGQRVGNAKESQAAKKQNRFHSVS